MQLQQNGKFVKIKLGGKMKSLNESIKEVIDILEKCHKMQKRTYKKGEIISNYLLNRKQICILISGTADLIRYESSGNKIIVERYRENDLFGEVFHPLTTNNELFVEAKEECEIIQFIYEDLEKKCTINCRNHASLIARLLDLVFYKTVNQNIRIEILNRNSIRDKLLFYFEHLENMTLQKNFDIPFSYTDLADYLNVNRSALMRELSHLEEDGFIERKGKKIKLKY